MSGSRCISMRIPLRSDRPREDEEEEEVVEERKGGCLGSLARDLAPLATRLGPLKAPSSIRPGARRRQQEAGPHNQTGNSPNVGIEGSATIGISAGKQIEEEGGSRLYKETSPLPNNTMLCIESFLEQPPGVTRFNRLLDPRAEP